MSIILSVGCGYMQDANNDSYDKVSIVYAADSVAGVIVALIITAFCFFSIDVRMLQWTRNQRITNGFVINERIEHAKTAEVATRNKLIKIVFFTIAIALALGAFAAYVWSAAVGYAY